MPIDPGIWSTIEKMEARLDRIGSGLDTVSSTNDESRELLKTLLARISKLREDTDAEFREMSKQSAERTKQLKILLRECKRLDRAERHNPRSR
jgi:capsule polysaccharide export protein KpsE/RkpR